MVSAFPNIRQAKSGRRGAVTRDVTFKDFSGGLYPIESENVLSPKFAPVLTNITIADEYSLVNRFGTQEFATAGDSIIELAYFNGAILAFLENGEIDKITDGGTVTTIWDSTIAGALSGSPSGWSGSLNHISYDESNGELIVFNGTDKPLLIDENHDVIYLQDPATGSNTNTPIAKHVAVVNNYTVAAGIASDPYTLIISSAGTSGVWVGDTSSDAVTFDIGNYVSKDSDGIITIKEFRKYLVVFLREAFVVIALGTYDGSDHVPDVVDVIDDLGSLGHKTLIKTERDILFMSLQGMYSARQATFTQTFETRALSDDIEPLLTASLANTLPATKKSFAVVDWLSRKAFYMIHDADDAITSFMMTFSKDLKKIKWNKLEGWSFTSACTSKKGRMFLAEGTKVYQYGNSVFSGEEYYQDYLDTNGENGTDVDIDWELPWLDYGSRVKTKFLRRLAADSIGNAQLTLQVFVDKIYKDSNGDYDPALEMPIVAGQTGGFGLPEVGFGGGRALANEQQFGFPVKFKLMKLRISGSVDAKALFSSISTIFSTGNYKR